MLFGSFSGSLEDRGLRVSALLGRCQVEGAQPESRLRALGPSELKEDRCIAVLRGPRRLPVRSSTAVPIALGRSGYPVGFDRWGHRGAAGR